MGKSRGVSIIVAEDFFKTFETARKTEQTRIRKKIGNVFNLTQKNFTEILGKRGFKFSPLKRKRR